MSYWTCVYVCCVSVDVYVCVSVCACMCVHVCMHVCAGGFTWDHSQTHLYRGEKDQAWEGEKLSSERRCGKGLRQSLVSPRAGTAPQSCLFKARGQGFPLQVSQPLEVGPLCTGMRRGPFDPEQDLQKHSPEHQLPTCLW